MKDLGLNLTNSTKKEHLHFLALLLPFLEVPCLSGGGVEAVACGIWQGFTPHINPPTLTFSKPGSEESAPFL